MQREHPLSYYYSLDQPLAETPSFVLARGRDRRTDELVCLWYAQRSLAATPAYLTEFIERMTLFSHLPRQELLLVPTTFGVDSSGIPFFVFQNLAGAPLKVAQREPAEVERLLLTTVRATSILHELGVALGEITPESFWIKPDGSVLLTQLGGTLGMKSSFAAPELTGEPMLGLGLGEDNKWARADVFALAAVAITLSGSDIGEVNGDAPVVGWRTTLAKGVLSASLHARIEQGLNLAPQLRPRDAVEMLRVFASETPPQPPHSDNSKPIASAGRDTARPTESGRLTSAAFSQPEEGKVSKSRASGWRQMKLTGRDGQRNMESRWKISARKVLLVTLVGTLGVVALWSIGNRFFSVSGATDIMAKTHAIEQRPANEPSNNQQLLQLQRRKELKALIDSDDPPAHATLLAQAVETRSLGERRGIEAAILSRSQRLGLQRTVSLARAWLVTFNGGEVPSIYRSILSLLDPLVTAAEIEKHGSEVIKLNSSIGWSLVVAVALDTGKVEELRGLFAQLGEQEAGVTDRNKLSAAGLLLTNSLIAQKFKSDLVSMVRRLTAEELPKVFCSIRQGEAELLQALGQRLLEEQSFAGIKNVYLKTSTQTNGLSLQQMRVLAAAACGQFARENVSVLARIEQEDGTRLLLAMLVDPSAESIWPDAFAILHARATQLATLGVLLHWAKVQPVAQRKQYAHAIGVLGLSQFSAGKDIDDALRTIGPMVENSQVRTELLKGQDPQLLSLVLRVYSDKFNPSDLTRMLYHPDSVMRLAAVRALANTTDAEVIREVTRTYAWEKDESVKAVYRNLFWMLR